MPKSHRFTIRYDPDSQAAIVRFSGVFDAATNIAAFEEAAERYDISQTNFLWDLRDVSFSQFSLDEIKKLRAFRAQYSNMRKQAKSCALVDDSVKKSLMELYHEVNLGVGPDTEVFLKEEQARAYLGIAPTFSLEGDD